jgi:hypothetical protein
VDALYACGTEPRDAFTLGISRDKGASFQALYRMVDTCPAECAEGTSFAAVCQEAWGITRPFVKASGAMCAVEWAAPVEDAGAEAEAGAGEMDAGVPEDDAGAEEEDAVVGKDGGEDAGDKRSGKDDGCGCGLVGDGHERARVDVSWMMVGVVVMWRRRRR